jgi:uncharacterized DUF497 family protein
MESRMLKASLRILRKLKDKHNVEWSEIEEAFLNSSLDFLEDDRKPHKTNPPTLWFVSQTDRGRLLKIVFMQNGTSTEIKSAYEPNKLEIKIYAKYTKKH